jgi:CubicO group peptidase (beta-lactamase class C family)
MSTLEDCGVASKRLARIKDMFNADVSKGTIPGAVALIARHGKLAYLESFGFRDRERRLPMVTDSIFRIASSAVPVWFAAVCLVACAGARALLRSLQRQVAADMSALR